MEDENEAPKFKMVDDGYRLLMIDAVLDKHAILREY